MAVAYERGTPVETESEIRQRETGQHESGQREAVLNANTPAVYAPPDTTLWGLFGSTVRIRNSAPLGPYRRTMPRVLGRS